MPTSPEASLRPPSSLRGRLGAGLRAASGRGDFPCFHPAFTLCPAGCSCSCRSSRPTSRSSSRWAPPSPPPRGTPAGFKSTDRQTNARPKSAGARAAPPPQLRLCPPPSAPPPQLHLARRSGGMPGTCVYGRDGRTPSISHQSPLYLPSISPRSPPRSQARDQRRATSTGVPPQRQGGGAALPRGALPVLHRLARSVRGRKPGGRVQVMPTWQP